jgi:hypothetical protein
MKLSPAVKFDKHKMVFVGFTDLGKYTPIEQKDKQGDHALVLLYPSFRGKWIQAIASFLSCGCATGDVLSQIVLEAIVLIENSNFFCRLYRYQRCPVEQGYVDKLFGITAKKPYCNHVMGKDRHLFFVSDFPYLVKNLWSFVLSKDYIQAYS